MLRKIRLKNFVHFEDETIEIETGNGPSIFMGENNSGKSCVLEAVRRCMSASKNPGMSNPHILDKIMFVSSTFTSNDPLPTDVLSSVIRPAGNRTEEGSDEYVIKVVYVKVHDGEKFDSKFAVDIVKENTKHVMVCTALSSTATSELKAVFETNDMEFDGALEKALNNFDSEIKKFANTKFPGEYSSTECEQILKDYVDSKTVMTFPLRSISPYQWTNSKRLHIDRTTENMKEVTEKAEILVWYLNNNDITPAEKAKEQSYFSILTERSSYEFQIDTEGNLIALNGNFIDGVRNSISILKVPEGIYEAKKVSIILSLDRFKTVCLEDPDRGMHTQMVERFRDLILQSIDDKVIILTSHQPSFLTPSTIFRTFLFRRNRHKDLTQHTFKIVPLSIIGTDGVPGGKKTIRIISSYSFATLFLSRRVIFVEGEGDFLFLTTLRQILLTNEIVTEFAQLCNTTKDKMMDVLCPLHVFPMIGEASKIKFHKVCQKLEVFHLFLLDNDALYNNIGTPKIKNTSNSNIFPFLVAFELETCADYCALVENDVSALEEHNIFVWKKTGDSTGTLDSTIAAFCKAENLLDFLKENNVKLSKKKKLFSEPNVTTQNITNVVSKLLRASLDSQNTNNEMFRLVKFLFESCQRQC